MTGGAEVEPEEDEDGSSRSSGHDNIVRFLLAQGAKVDRAYNDFTPLIEAAVHDRTAALATLLDAGADPARSNSSGTALHWAARNRAESVVRIALQARAAAGIDRG